MAVDIKKCLFLSVFVLFCNQLQTHFKVQNISWHNKKEIQKVQDFLDANPGFHKTDMNVCFVPKIKENVGILLVCKSILSGEMCGFLFCELDNANKTALLTYDVIPEQYNNQKQEIFSLLLEEMQHRCKAQFLKMMYCCANKSNKLFYAKFGFYERHALVGTVTRLVLFDSPAIIYMQKKL